MIQAGANTTLLEENKDVSFNLNIIGKLFFLPTVLLNGLTGPFNLWLCHSLFDGLGGQNLGGIEGHSSLLLFFSYLLLLQTLISPPSEIPQV